MSTLVVVLESVGVPWERVSPVMQRELVGWIATVAHSEMERDHLVAGVKAKLCYSPLTAHVASLAVLDVERGEVAVYYVDELQTEDSYIDGVTYKPRSERQLLLEFWQGAEVYDRFVTFSGRKFLAPFLLHRSAIHGVMPTVDLLESRYLDRQRGVEHVDLLDQLTFDGAWERRPSLRMLCAAYGILGIPERTLVQEALKDGAMQAVAQHTCATAVATLELYQHWQEYFSPLKQGPLNF